MTDVHAAVRTALAEELAIDEGHLAACPDCADFAVRLHRVRTLAPSLGDPPAPLGLADAVLDRLATAPTHEKSRAQPLRRLVLRSALSAAAVVALLLAALVVLPNRNDAGTDTGTADLSNVLLASADETAARDTARLRLQGRAQTAVVRPGRTPVVSAVTFDGAGELAAGQGIRVSLSSRRLDEGVASSTYEYLGLGERAFSRRTDGRWDEVDGPQGPLAAVLLDAGTSLDILRAAKRGLVDLGTDAKGWRHLRYDVVHPAPLGRPGAEVAVDAWVDGDDLLRRITMTSTGTADQGEATVSWSTATTLEFSDFGADVVLTPPLEAEVVGRAAVAVDPGQSWLLD